jgi:hypothetical protein
MHRGVQDFISWIAQNPEPGISAGRGLAAATPATAVELAAVEERIASPLPADLRFVLSRYNGGEVPSGQLLSAGDGAPESILSVADELSKRMSKSLRDPELLLPFYRSDDGGILAFDRSGGPVADTWPIIDYYLESGEQRLVHRTFDGFCRLRVAEWSSPDFGGEFSLESYLNSGKRHVTIEPDVSIAHATVAHALRRAGQPEIALQAYLDAARCLPAQPWCDWEALKLSALLGDGRAAWESSVRLAARATKIRWRQRETTPALVADTLAVIAPRLSARAERVLRLYDQLQRQADNERERQHIAGIRRALMNQTAPPPPLGARIPSIAPLADTASWITALAEGYRRGKLRDEDLLFAPSYAALRAKYALAQVLRVSRTFA